MEQNFLSTLLARGQRGELASGKLKEELGAHVAELAGQIQDLTAHFSSLTPEQLVFDPVFNHFDLHTARALIDFFEEVHIQPLVAERELCTGRLIVDAAFEANQENPGLAAALFSLVTD